MGLSASGGGGGGGARSEIWKPFLAGGGDEVIRSLLFFAIEGRVFLRSREVYELVRVG